MEHKKTRITIVGSVYAKPGTQFVYIGRADQCESCTIAQVCHNLESGRRYEVLAIRAASHHCPVHQGGAVTVDVTDAPVEMRISPELAQKNTTIVMKFIECDEACDFFAACHPPGVVEGQKYIITEVLESDPVPCRTGPSPVLVRVVPLPEGLPRYTP
ncbi:UPF0179 family protein [Methanospirillum sp.]|uniref:UPF0179 family protein n=1 Tax=Methanospirillum sp. TaxID=45200 RepID=UPI0035A1A4AF